MKLRLLAFAALPALVSAPASAGYFTLDFENVWDYSNGDVNDYYNGGTAGDGATGPNFGVSFTGVSGLSNDSSFTYYDNAPSMVGVAYAYTTSPGDTAFMNVAAGIENALWFSYSSPSDVAGAVLAYTGLNGTGTLLGSLDLAANSGSDYDTWTKAYFTFNGTARSLNLTGSANIVQFDNLSNVPELDAAGSPAAFMLIGGLLALAAGSRAHTARGT